MDTQTLGTTGTYQMWVQHSGSVFGSETLQLKSVPPDVYGTLTVPAAGATGPTSTVTITGAGQNGYLTFSGTTGQLLSFNITNSAYSSSTCIWFLKDPAGTQISSGSCTNGFVDLPLLYGALRSTGTFTLLIDPQKTATGAVTWSINNDADVTGTITIDGPAVTTGTVVAGQDARLSFSAANQRIGTYITNVSNPAATVKLVKPDGTNQASTTINNNPVGQTFFLDSQSLGTGTYQLLVQHTGVNFGNETLQMFTVPADVAGSVTIGGAAFTFTTSVGQNANITFNNPQSQHLTVHWTSGTYPTNPSCTLTVTGPSPSTNTVGTGSCSGATGSVNLGTPAAGNYNILVNPFGQGTGGMSLTVTTP
jgi:hypothetical protein